jgi:hypothetical protein
MRENVVNQILFFFKLSFAEEIEKLLKLHKANKK